MTRLQFYRGVRPLDVVAGLGLVVVLLASGLGVPAAPPPPPGPDASQAMKSRPMEIGMNLAGIVDWSTEWDFVDVFKASRDWIPQTAAEGGPWSTGQRIRCTPQGWPLLQPGQAAATLMCREIHGHYPAGTYICTYQGSGELRFGFDAKQVKPLGAGRLAVRVEPGEGGIFLRIVRSDPADPVRDIHVWMPGFEQRTSPFHPLFLKRLAPFKVLRFMDWQCTNNSTLEHWSQRTTPDSARQSGPNGVALEYMIELCNELHADPWFCMPHRADDDFVRHFAQMVRDRLHPDATIYVEWSNEAWNGLFGQARWVYQEAQRRGVPFTQVIAERARHDWNLWRQVLGPRADHLVRVAAGQHYNPQVAQGLLEALHGDCDAISCACYFGVQNASGFSAETTGREVVDSCLDNIRDKCLPMLAEHKALARQWSARTGHPIRLLCYEAGQHILPIGGFEGGQQGFVTWKQAAWDCQTTPLMYDAYARMLSGAQDAGADLVMAFSYVGLPSKWGSWGVLQYQDEPLAQAPKYRALADFARRGAAAGGPNNGSR